jgi:hypothetical protein
MSSPKPSPTDPLDAWRQRLTEAEREWNQYMNEMMGTDAFAQVMGTWTNGFLMLQKNMGESVERYMASFNVPTRSDVMDLGERLGRIEDRLRRLEKAVAPGAEGAAAARRRPTRTRRPTSPPESPPESPPKATATPKAAKPKKAAKSKRKAAKRRKGDAQ